MDHILIVILCILFVAVLLIPSNFRMSSWLRVRSLTCMGPNYRIAALKPERLKKKRIRNPQPQKISDKIAILLNFLFNRTSDTISLRTGGQGHATPIHTYPPPHAHSHTDNHECSIRNAHFHKFRLDHHESTDGPTDQWTDGQSLL